MRAASNKRILEDIFADLALGDGRSLMEAMTDDVTWIIIGTTPCSGTYRGKEKVRDHLLAPLFAQFASRYKSRAARFIAEGDHVVVECRGEVTTKSGQPYNNTYCFVFRFSDGQIGELTEYSDTALVERVLAPPRAFSA